MGVAVLSSVKKAVFSSELIGSPGFPYVTREITFKNPWANFGIHLLSAKRYSISQFESKCHERSFLRSLSPSIQPPKVNPNPKRTLTHHDSLFLPSSSCCCCWGCSKAPSSSPTPLPIFGHERVGH